MHIQQQMPVYQQQVEIPHQSQIVSQGQHYEIPMGQEMPQGMVRTGPPMSLAQVMAQQRG